MIIDLSLDFEFDHIQILLKIEHDTIFQHLLSVHHQANFIVFLTLSFISFDRVDKEKSKILNYR
jgi:hypothetical protein